jgi:hypothetical protein
MPGAPPCDRDRVVLGRLTVLRGDKPTLVRDDDELGPVAGVEFGQQAPDVGFHGGEAQVQELRYVRIGQSTGDEREDLALPLGYAMQAGGHRLGRLGAAAAGGWVIALAAGTLALTGRDA